MTGGPSLTVDRPDTTEEERGGDIPPAGFDPTCMSVVTRRDLAAGQPEPGADDPLITKWAESLVAKAVDIRNLFGGCPAETARYLIGPAERQAKGAIEFISDPSRREELMGRLRKAV